MNENKDKPDAGSDKPGMIAEHMRHVAQPGFRCGDHLRTHPRALHARRLVARRQARDESALGLAWLCLWFGGGIHPSRREVSPGTLFGSRARKAKGRSGSGSGNG